VNALENGAVTFLCKPFNKEELIEVVNRAIEQDRKAIHEDIQIKNIQKRYHLLTTKEKEVLHFVALGLKNIDTAAEEV
ncbi:MAG: DNA-binding response regulator, partial [Deltaproteobacteria bacterium]|nr:DNA-binding response regulator [Deltaproteobacteria bacterium]